MRSTAVFAITITTTLAACGFQGTAASDDDPRPLDGAQPGDDAPVACTVLTPDEDLDGVADVCDPCPQLANAPAADTDRDTIPDACDPHVNAADVRVTFAGFADGNVPAGWTEMGPGASQIESGDLVMTSGNDPDFYRIDSGGPRHTVEVGYTVTALTGGGGSVQTVAGLVDLSDATDRFFLCGTRFDEQERDFWLFGAGSPEELAAQDTTLTPNVRYTVRASVEPDGPDCFVDGLHLETMRTPVGNRGVGLRSRNVVVRYHYVAIYTH